MSMMLIDQIKDSACKTAEANAIRAKTGGSAQIVYDWENNKGFADAIDAIQTGGGTPTSEPLKDVNFYDYDGTRLFSYTAEEFDELAELPANPSHDGLIAQGWNYTIAQAKSCLQTYGGCDIGQLYTTSDGKTRIYVELTDECKDPTLAIALDTNETATVYWGDGEFSNITGRGLNYGVSASHSYSAAGSYVISISVTGQFKFYSNGSYSRYSQMFFDGASYDAYAIATGFLYLRTIKRIEIGDGCVGIMPSAFNGLFCLETITFPNAALTLDYNCFQNCQSLRSVTLPNGVTSLPQNCFSACYKLCSVSLPSSIASMSSGVFNDCRLLERIVFPFQWSATANYVYQASSLKAVLPPPSYGASVTGFQNCYSLKKIVIPDTVTSIGVNAFSQCNNAAGSVVIPEGVTAIQNSAFYMCVRISEWHLRPTTPPSLYSARSICVPANCTIYVPYSADHSVLNAYKSATNWSTHASYMQEEAAP